MSKYTRIEWNHRKIKCMYGRFSCELPQQKEDKT